MPSYMVSVRLPDRLLEELREKAAKDHFLDTSEAVRGIVRDRWQKDTNPLAYELQQMRQDISESMARKTQENLLDELKKIRDEIAKKK